MHRSRLSVLVILAAAAAACSKHDASEESAILSEDRTLVARLDLDQESHKPALPAACGTIAIAAQPAVSIQHQADELTRQAGWELIVLTALDLRVPGRALAKVAAAYARAAARRRP